MTACRFAVPVSRPILVACLLLSFLMVGSATSRSQGYYPLQKGNVWQYEDLDAPGSVVYQEVALGETVLVNGKSYMRIWSGSASDYVRQVDTRVYYWSPLPYDSLGWEKLWYDFSKGPGDTVSAVVVNGDTVDFVIVLAAGRGLFWGRELAWWTFTGNFGKIAVSDSIGVTYVLYEGGYEIRLRGAIIDGKTYGLVTGIESATYQQAAETQFLLQNHPNPFNRSTKIQFGWPVDGRAKIAVYDILGREVAVVLDESLPAGVYQFEFDGAGLPSGVYLYRLTAGSFVETRKLVLVR
jgi:hypothetical protein